MHANRSTAYKDNGNRHMTGEANATLSAALLVVLKWDEERPQQQHPCNRRRRPKANPEFTLRLRFHLVAAPSPQAWRRLPRIRRRGQVQLTAALRLHLSGQGSACERRLAMLRWRTPFLIAFSYLSWCARPCRCTSKETRTHARTLLPIRYANHRKSRYTYHNNNTHKPTCSLHSVHSNNYAQCHVMPCEVTYHHMVNRRVMICNIMKQCVTASQWHLMLCNEVGSNAMQHRLISCTVSLYYIGACRSSCLNFATFAHFLCVLELCCCFTPAFISRIQHALSAFAADPKGYSCLCSQTVHPSVCGKPTTG